MTSPTELMAQSTNPFVATRTNPVDDALEPVYELKFGMIFYTAYPPGPKRARAVFDLYMAKYGNRIRRYVSTSPGDIVDDFVLSMVPQFQARLLPELRKKQVWGYGFDDGKEFDGLLFMFHGFRPVSQPGRAGFFRFEFRWNVDPMEVRQLAIDINQLIPYESGFAGYFFKPAIDESSAYDAMYAVTRRFWGIEAWNLEVSASHVLEGYQSVNWLTLIGESLRQRDQAAVERAKQRATAFFESPNGTILQAAERPLLGDQNRSEPMPGYVGIAEALQPLQLTQFGSFGGERWDPTSSLSWIRRFTGG
jgi:hypothetical protein